MAGEDIQVLLSQLPVPELAYAVVIARLLVGQNLGEALAAIVMRSFFFSVGPAASRELSFSELVLD